MEQQQNQATPNRRQRRAYLVQRFVMLVNMFYQKSVSVLANNHQNENSTQIVVKTFLNK